MSYTDLESLLKQAMGLDAASIGSAAVGRAVQARMSACATRDLPAYAALARASIAETQALMAAIVVPETWFFRDREAFTTLTRLVREEWLPAHPHGVLRLLSLPCASGEEPYSMAMALLDAGVPADRFRIDALDISARILARARRAHYGKNSFRSADLGFRDRHFDAGSHGYHLHEDIRAQVHLHRANLLAPTLPAEAAAYGFIFCRNLLIYFDRATQDRAVHVLQGMLEAQGVLFVGPSESALLLNHDFVSARVPLAFAFRRKTLPAPGVAPLPDAGRPGTPAVAAVARAMPEPDRPIDVASRLADQGRLEEATGCFEAHVRRYGPSAQAYHLIGLIRAAAGRLAEADQYYRKALYLDPNHHDTLLHLALLLEKLGARDDASVLRARISRLPHERTDARES